MSKTECKDFPTSFEKSRPGRRATTFPRSDAGEGSLEGLIPAKHLRRKAPVLPELAEIDVVRHYTALSRRNVGVDSTFYPLGSCTMKYNPKVNEAAAALPGFARVHPCQPASTAQGWLQMIAELEGYLCEMGGFEAATLQPAAGAHGELTGLMVIRAFHDERGGGRTEVLVPDSAHGTNPASCTLAGFKTVQVRSDERGLVDLADLEAKLSDRTAALMLTNPNTVGLFESNVCRIATLLHDKGAKLYMDGANFNAINGIARPGDFGVDVMHFNLHKSFSTPHGGGGPGSGPVAVAKDLVPYLPVPRVVRKGGAFAASADFPKSIGPVRSWMGNVGVALKAYVYVRHLGARGLKEATEAAVLNANYLLARLKDAYALAYGPPCMHECVFSGKRLEKETGIRALDVAKGLIERGYHPPTIYFPLIVPEALMIEPTETESLETLDAFADAMLDIAAQAKADPAALHAAPSNTPVGRLDEVRAVKEPCLRFHWDEACRACGGGEGGNRK
ncbi:MAG: aminomethyl-transferring glycine dehydrogenase subunit GcvPB [Planctomycetes bacterium]|nr:aminomethyl-transferring glycine dehydrogenase subunit GcvPB [Planctomycetota bacterium]